MAAGLNVIYRGGESSHPAAAGPATVSSVANRIREVIAAPPGLVTVDQLAPMRLYLDPHTTRASPTTIKSS